MKVGQKLGYKVCTIGLTSVGKTALVNRYVSDLFSASPLPTIQAILTSKTEIIKGNPVKLNIWDTAGQERYKSTVPIYLRDADCIILVFDVQNEDSWEAVKDWYENETKQFDPMPLIIVCGNKTDMPPSVSEDTIKEWCETKKLTYYLTSASSGKGVKKMFKHIATLVMERNPSISKDLSIAAAYKKPCAC